jgi:hypothetical protein
VQGAAQGAAQAAAQGADTGTSDIGETAVAGARSPHECRACSRAAPRGFFEATFKFFSRARNCISL